MQNNEPSLTSMHQMVLEISHFKVRNLRMMDVAILYVSSLILQDSEKIKVQYLTSLFFYLFETLQAVRT